MSITTDPFMSSQVDLAVRVTLFLNLVNSTALNQGTHVTEAYFEQFDSGLSDAGLP